MRKIPKRLFALLIALTMTLQMVCVMSFASDSILLVNESFNSYVTNEIPEKLSVTGNQGYVTEYKKEDKGFKFELNKSSQELKFSADLGNEYYISFDICADKTLTGAVKVSDGTNSMSILKFDSRKLQAYNGKSVSGIGSAMTNVKVLVNSKLKVCTIYVNNRAKISDCYISNMNVTSGKSVVFEFSSGDGSSVVCDNINIGNGSIPKQFPVAPYNDAAVERKEYVPVVTEDIYMNVDLENGSRLNAAFNSKGNILEVREDEEKNHQVYFKRTTSSDFHLDIYKDVYPSDCTVYQYDIKIPNEDVSVRSYFQAKSGNTAAYCSLSGGVLSAGSRNRKLTPNQWHTVSAVYDVYNGIFSVYLDYELISDDVIASPSYDEKNADIWRLHVSARASGSDEFYADNFIIYGGTKPRKMDISSSAQDLLADKRTAWESDEPFREFLKDKVSYHTKSGVLYANGKKSIVNPEIINNTTYVPVEFFESAFGYEISSDNSHATIGNIKVDTSSDIALIDEKSIQLTAKPVLVNEKIYVPLRDFCQTVLNKKFTYDSATYNGGMVIMSDMEIAIPDEMDLQNLNDFAFYLRPESENLIADFDASGYKNVHPRVMADKSDFDRIRSLVKTDENMQYWSRSVISRADELMLKDKPLIYELRDGVRLWYVSLELIEHMSSLGMAYQLTGEKKYAKRAYADLESVAKFSSWHPEHDIDVGGMAIGYAIGYDWMYDAFDEKERALLEEGAMNNGFYALVQGYQGRHGKMKMGLLEKGNHCMVDNAGSAMLSVAFFDSHPDYASYCLASSIRCLEFGISQYGSDGSWFEGSGYGAMTLEYLTYQLSSIQNVFDTCYTLDNSQGLNNIIKFFLHVQSPQGAFGFSDGSSQGITYDSGLLWIGQHFKDYETLSTFFNLFGLTPDYRNLLWYNSNGADTSIQIPLDKFYEDQQSLTMRDSWDKDTQTSFAAFKGGQPSVHHGHIDVGTFSFYANDTQWTHDFSSEDYNLDGYWEAGSVDTKRWQYYRLRGEGHNCIIINPDSRAEYDPTVKAMATRIETKPKGAIGVIDLTESNYGKVDSARRGFYYADDRRSLVIRDEVNVNAQTTAYWFMHTTQNAKVSDDGKSVILSKKGDPSNYVKLEFVSDARFELSIVPASPLPTSPHPSGMSDDSTVEKISVKIVTDKDFSLTAKLTPCSVESPTSINDYNTSIDNWQIPDGEILSKPVLDSLTIDGIKYNTSKTIISHITTDTSTTFANIDAASALYNVEVEKAATVNDMSYITVSDKNNPNNKAIYRISYKVYKTMGIPNITEYPIAKIEASEEPQTQNGAMNLIDRDLNSRWSAQGEQYVIIDLGREVSFNTIYMAFLDGTKRCFNIQIGISKDGSEYKLAYDGTSTGLTDDYEEFNVGAQSARYVKIYGAGSNLDMWNSWKEVGVALK